MIFPLSFHPSMRPHFLLIFDVCYMLLGYLLYISHPSNQIHHSRTNRGRARPKNSLYKLLYRCCAYQKRNVMACHIMLISIVSCDAIISHSMCETLCHQTRQTTDEIQHMLAEGTTEQNNHNHKP